MHAALYTLQSIFKIIMHKHEKFVIYIFFISCLLSAAIFASRRVVSNSALIVASGKVAPFLTALRSCHSQPQGGSFTRYELYEFFDYECPPYRKLVPRLEELETRFDIAVYRCHFPLSMHSNASNLALISLALQDRKLDAFHAKELSCNEGSCATLAMQWTLKLDSSVSNWREKPRTALSKVRSVANSLGVFSTPTVYVYDNATGNMYQCQTFEAVQEALTRPR
ncbi:MAG: hypothetical protein JSS71_07945 [Armatimonadetes bacterium]|nr:hypothetical protein [Armatimonadota bacterium]MBX3109806.1 hypothetical protein [Fimbriimonadaceae bacterium]